MKGLLLMKIMTWNAAMRFRDKIEEILPFTADILVIPECEAPEKWKKSNPSINQFLWFGDNLNKGTGIFTLNNSYQISLHPAYNKDFRYIIPLIVTGEEDFILFAVWSQFTKKRSESYIGQIYLALKFYKSLLQQPCVIIGDWNSNKIFDYIKRVGTHTEVVDFLSSFNIKSAYHHYFNEEHGQESLPTHYFRKEKERPFHLDYIFASDEFMKRIIHLEIGSFEKWIHLSDHLPIFAEFQK
jgi:exonuclease III